jgi:hydroxyacylglutathione hydrolase
MLKNLIPRNFLSFQIRTMKVIPIPANQDNYQYLIIDDNGKKQAAIVDPVDVSEIKKVVEKENVQLIAGFVTHHHMDHSAHSGRLRSTFGDTTEVFGHDSKRINGQTLDTVHGGTFSLGDLKVTTYHTPCHTSTHVCYFVVDQKSNERAVFTGDTLFIGGCGRFFEGNAQEMDEALNKTLADLPDDTKVYCGHEYTVQNLKFAKKVDPNNPAVEEKFKWAQKLRESKQYTIPSTIGDEKKYNPFMRVREDALKAATGKTDPIDVMQALRDMKNNM